MQDGVKEHRVWFRGCVSDIPGRQRRVEVVFFVLLSVLNQTVQSFCTVSLRYHKGRQLTL